jgi:chemotaxis protein methyltransferase CheR
MLVLNKDMLSPRDLRRIAAVVHEHCGINLHDGKQELVQARLTKLLRHSRFRSIGEYLDYVLDRQDSPEFAELIDSLSTNLTSFFREGDHFTYLAREFLPACLAHRQGAGTTVIRGWSAACSSGEEPYSLAVVLQDFLESAGGAMTARLLATDISHRMLAAAREGRYDRRRIIPVPPQYRHYFYSCAQDPRFVEPAPEIRRLISFAHLNLLETWPFTGPLDFIFCRNVMIYFDKPTQQRLIERFFDILSPGGVLCTGHSESLTGITHRFNYVRPTIYMKSSRST